MVKDIRYIIKKVIIGVLIGVALIMFKSYRVNAATIDTNINANVYFKTQYCSTGTAGSGLYDPYTFTCENGPSMKFVQLLNSDQNVSVPMFISQGQLINNMTFEMNFEDGQTITSTDRYVVLRIPWLSSNISNGVMNLYANSYFTTDSIRNNSVIHYAPSVSTYMFQPQYCSYEDTTGYHNCNVYIYPNSTIERYAYYIDIPVGTTFNQITLFFGNNNVQSTYSILSSYGTIVNYYPLTTTRNMGTCNSSTSNENCFKNTFNNYKNYSSNDYNVYGSNTYSGAGLLYYRYPPVNPTFNPSNVTENVFFESNMVVDDAILYNYNSYSQELVDYYNNLATNIENELNPSVNIDGFFTDFLEGFTTSTQASGLLSLFNNMFLYPMQKLNTNASVDLVRLNLNGDYILNDFICMKNSTASYPSTYNAYEVHFYRDYKFKLPCPHTEIYNKLYYGEYGFYGNNFKGAAIHTGIQYSFVDIWLTIQHGLLVYLLFVNCLNIYKYVLDSNKTEIEVLEL